MTPITYKIITNKITKYIIYLAAIFNIIVNFFNYNQQITTYIDNLIYLV